MLVKCRECGEMFSSLAKSCPHCGCPAESRLSRMKIAIPLKRQLLGMFGFLVKAVMCVLPLLIIGTLVHLTGVLDRYYYDPVPYVKDAVDLNLDKQVEWKDLTRFCGMDRNRPEWRDKEVCRFVVSPEAEDGERVVETLDAYTKNRWGVISMRGDMWNADRQPFKDARLYRDKMLGFLMRGYEGFASPGYMDWQKAMENRDRLAQKKLVRKYAFRLGHIFLTQDELEQDQDRLVAEYDARMKAENLVGVYQAFNSKLKFTEKERDVIFLLVKGEMTAECAEELLNLSLFNAKRAKVIRGLAGLCKPSSSMCWLDEAIIDSSNNRSYGQNTRDAEGLGLLALLLTFVVAVPFCLAVHYGWKRAIAKPVEWTFLVVMLLLDVGLFWRATLKTSHVAVITIGITLCVLLMIVMLAIMLRRPQICNEMIDSLKPRRRFRIRAPWSLIVPSMLANLLFVVLVLSGTIYIFEDFRSSDVSALILLWGAFGAFAAVNFAVLSGSRTARGWLMASMGFWLLVTAFRPLSLFLVAVIEVPWLWALFSSSAQRWFEAHKRLDERRRRRTARQGRNKEVE